MSESEHRAANVVERNHALHAAMKFTEARGSILC